MKNLTPETPGPSAAREYGLSERRLAWMTVAAVVIVQALALWHEVEITRLDLNDHLFHYIIASRMAEALAGDESPVDLWVSEWTFGYPVPRTYQPLGHLALAGLYVALGDSVDLMTLFSWVRYLLLCLWPVTVAISARWLSLRPSAAAAAAFVAPLVATDGLFGLEWGSYVWRGQGLYTQCWAMHGLALTVGLAWRALRRGKQLSLAGLVLGLTFLAHPVYGYIGAVSIALLALLARPRWPRLVRMAAIGSVAAAVSAFQLWSLLSDAELIPRSRWEPEWKWSSYGAREVAAKLMAGDLLDADRFPSLSLLALAGAGVAMLAWLAVGAEKPSGATTVEGRWRSAVARLAPANDRSALLFLVVGAIFWLLFFCGRPTWGESLRLLAVSDSMPLHRLLGGAHLFLIWLAGLGLGSAWSLTARGGLVGAVGTVALTLLMLWPALAERRAYLQQNREWGEQSLAAYDTAKPQLDSLLAQASYRSGRVYVELGARQRFRVGWVPAYVLVGLQRLPIVDVTYHAMALTADLAVKFQKWRPEHYRLYNVSTVLSEAGVVIAPFLTASTRAGRFQLWEAPVTGYFELVTAPTEVVVTRQSFYDVNKSWLDSDGPGQRQHLRLAMSDQPGDTPSFEAAAADGCTLGTVLWEQRRGEVYRARVQIERSSYLLFKMTHHRNWRVTANGEPRQTVMLSPGFVGVALEPGTFEVECRYQSPATKTVLFFLAAPFFLLAWAAEGARSRHDRLH